MGVDLLIGTGTGLGEGPPNPDEIDLAHLRVATDSLMRLLKSSSEYLKQNPGKVEASIADAGSADHYTWLAFTKASGITADDLRWMPCGGGAPRRVKSMPF